MTDLLVLSYHAVSSSWPSPLAVTPEALGEQISYLLRRGYQPITATDVVRQSACDRRRFAITFDDSYRSVVKYGFPVLERLGVRATIFVPTDYIGSEEPMAWAGIDHWKNSEFSDELIPTSWDELRQVAAAGWEIGSHTCSHPRLSQISSQRLTYELSESRQICEDEIGAACTSIAYPYGDHDDAVGQAVKQAGYEVAFTVPDQLVAGDSLRWPRVGIYRDDSKLTFRAKTSRSIRAARASETWPRIARTIRTVRGRR